jgi:putative two-component system response regulator
MNAKNSFLSGCVLEIGLCEPCPELDEILDNSSCHRIKTDSPREALTYLRQNPNIDLVLIVPTGSLRSYTELCRNIKYGLASSYVSVIFVLTPDFEGERARIFEAGAMDCIQMPAPRSEIILRLLNAMQVKRATETLEDANTVIIALANAIEGKDPYTCGHVERVATYSVEIGKRAGIADQDLAALRTGAMVHDIGKVVVPEHILNKPGRLNEIELEIMKRHPITGHDILKPLHTFSNVLPIVRWHHEKPNGTGYPDGLAGDNLPILPRIVAVADCFDAIITDRPYRPALPFETCLDILREEADKGGLDARMVKILLEILDEGGSQLAAMLPSNAEQPVNV